MVDPVIYHPKKDFPKFKGILHEHATEFFDDLVKRAGTDIEANKKHVKEYNAQKQKESAASKKLNSSKGLMTFVIVMAVLCFSASFILVFIPFINIEKLWWLFFIVGALILIGIGLILVVALVLNKKVKSNRSILDIESKKTKDLLEICYNDMASLNSLYDYNLPSRLMDDVIDILKMDEYCSIERISDLVENYHFNVESDINSTTLNALTGEMLNNPFALITSSYRYMAPKTYFGSIVVMVRVRRTDSKGRVYYTTESQTLTATTVHDAPSYSGSTELFYANDAAPNLKFVHSPSKANSLDTKGQEKYVRNHIKDIIKLSDEALKKGKSNFTPLGNDTFDVFFGATDRNNEIEFRLLFTALAQQNMVNLMCDHNPYGDDFSFRKNKKINIIHSGHSQIFNYFPSLDFYRHYDYEYAREHFINYIDDYFKNLYFDFAPLLSIPVYQIHKGHPLKKDAFYSNYSSIEHEIFANKLNKEYFRPKDSNPSQRVIVSLNGSHKVGNIDVISINGSSYQTYPEVDMIPRVASDGVTHLVPVHWTRYEERNIIKDYALVKVSDSLNDFRMNIDKLPSDVIDLNNMHYERGLFAFTAKSEINLSLSNTFEKLFSKKES